MNTSPTCSVSAVLQTLPFIALLFLLLGCASQNRPLQLISGEGPRYPQQAKQQGVEGEVLVAYDVDESGRVLNARVVRSVPSGIFDEAALAAVRSWRFNPPLLEGQAQAAKNLESNIAFKLSGADKYQSYD